MAEQHIPDDIAAFVLDRIDSVAQLEALLLLRGNKGKEWSVMALAARLYISEEQTADLLVGLSGQGFVAPDPAGSVIYPPIPTRAGRSSTSCALYPSC